MSAFFSRAQIALQPFANPLKYNLPELLLPVDARSAALGETGITKDDDVFAAYWNPSKYIFNEDKLDLGLNYTTTPDYYGKGNVFGNLACAWKVNEKNAVAISADYYNYGKPSYIVNVDQFAGLKDYHIFTGLYYAHKLNEKFSVGGGLKYYYSRMANYFELDPNANVFTSKGLAADVSMIYRNDIKFMKRDATLSLGADVSNLGPKSSYEHLSVQEPLFIPADLGLGSSLGINMNEKNKLNVYLDVDKLLVPTPDTTDENNIIGPDYLEKSALQGIFTSFTDAPGGASEEFNEIGWRSGIEYWYDDLLALRIGYFITDNTKQNEQFFTFGAGLKNKIGQLDAAFEMHQNTQFLIPDGYTRILLTMTCNFCTGRKAGS